MAQSNGDGNGNFSDPWTDGSVPRFEDGGRPGHGQPVQHPPLVGIDPGDWQGKSAPPLEWLIADWVPKGEVTCLSGHGATGKTLLAQMLMTSCALGRKWLGLPTVGCKSVGVFCEDTVLDLQRRQERINSAFQCAMVELSGQMVLVPRRGMDNVLMRFRNDAGTATDLVDRIIERVLAIGAGLCVLDTLSDLFDGSENDRPQVRFFCQYALTRICLETGAAVVICAHPSRSGLADNSGQAGSTQWANSFRAMAHLTSPKPTGEDDDPNRRVLTRVKANYARMGESLEMVWDRGIFRPVEARDADMPAHIRHASCDASFLDLFRKCWANDLHVYDSPQIPRTYAPAIFAKHPDNDGYSKKDYQAAMERLLYAGKLKRGSVRIAGRQISCLIMPLQVV